jgi:hypothetical protein
MLFEEGVYEEVLLMGEMSPRLVCHAVNGCNGCRFSRAALHMEVGFESASGFDQCTVQMSLLVCTLLVCLN